MAVGDIIEFLGEVEEGWWRGKLAGKIGVFPSNFVSAFASASPILANRRSNNSMNTSRSGTSLNSSREDLVSNASTVLIGEKEAPSLPPKPGKSFLFGFFFFEKKFHFNPNILFN